MLIFKLRYIRETHEGAGKNDTDVIEWHITDRYWLKKEDALNHVRHISESRKVELLRWDSETDSHYIG